MKMKMKKTIDLSNLLLASVFSATVLAAPPAVASLPSSAARPGWVHAAAVPTFVAEGKEGDKKAGDTKAESKGKGKKGGDKKEKSAEPAPSGGGW